MLQLGSVRAFILKGGRHVVVAVAGCVKDIVAQLVAVSCTRTAPPRRVKQREVSTPVLELQESPTSVWEFTIWVCAAGFRIEPRS